MAPTKSRGLSSPVAQRVPAIVGEKVIVLPEMIKTYFLTIRFKA
jgi:hypothetical protein